MANRKVKPENKKKPMGYSIKTQLADDFTAHCIEKELCASTIVEELITQYMFKFEALNEHKL